jgi:hypothetical protein
MHPGDRQPRTTRELRAKIRAVLDADWKPEEKLASLGLPAPPFLSARPDQGFRCGASGSGRWPPAVWLGRCPLNPRHVYREHRRPEGWRCDHRHPGVYLGPGSPVRLDWIRLPPHRR